MKCPPCFISTGYLAPPDCYNEQSRKQHVEQYLKLKHWEDPSLFRPFLSHVKKSHRVSGISISLIHRTKVSVKFESRLNFKEIPRHVSLDSHALLSKGCFCLPDALQDWRTSKNPLVAGYPELRYYCGVSLVDPENVPIGVLAVFDTHPKSDINEDMVLDLIKTAESLMQLLATPYDIIMRERQKKKEIRDRNYSVVDAELEKLSNKLGRATSRNSCVTVFEKDGSGNPYSPNHNFSLTRVGQESESVKANLLSESQRHAIFRMLYKVGSLRTASDILCRSLAETYGANFVFILELRSADLYTIPTEYFPKGQTKVEMDIFEHANKLNKSKRKLESSERMMIKVLGTYGCNLQTAKYDDELLVAAMQVDFGVRYENPTGNASFNNGVILPFYRHPAKLVKKSTKASDAGEYEVYVGAGGYLVGVFTEHPGQCSFKPDMISKIFDHTSILRKLYIS